MRLTVLGKSPAWQDAGGACSGYLLTEGATTLLLDCGSGVFGKLRGHADYVAVDAVVVSHLHADHILDLVPFASALTYAPRQQPVPVPPWPGTDTPARPALHAPPGAREAFRQICAGSGMSATHIEDAFDLREYDPAETVEVGPLRVRFCAVPHFIPTQAVEVVSSASGGRLTFSADSAPSGALIEFASGTDLLLVEATLPRPERQGPRGHLTPAEAGQHARAASSRAQTGSSSSEMWVSTSRLAPASRACCPASAGVRCPRGPSRSGRGSVASTSRRSVPWANSTSAPEGAESAEKVNRPPDSVETTSTAWVGMKCGTPRKRSRSGPTSTVSAGSYSRRPKASSMWPGVIPDPAQIWRNASRAPGGAWSEGRAGESVPGQRSTGTGCWRGA